MRAMVVVMLAACGARSTPAPVAEPPPPKRDLAVAEPPPKQPVPPEQPMDRAWIIRNGRSFDASNAPIRRRVGPPVPQEMGVAARDLWSPCVRDFVQAQAPDVRRTLNAAFARYVVACDASQRVVVEPPPDYRDRSVVVLRGPLAAITLDVVVCGATSARDTVAIVYDGKRWSGTGASEQVGNCTVTSVPDMPSLRRVLRDVLDARDATVQDIAITDDLKRDLGLMLDALDALSAR